MYVGLVGVALRIWRRYNCTLLWNSPAMKHKKLRQIFSNECHWSHDGKMTLIFSSFYGFLLLYHKYRKTLFCLYWEMKGHGSRVHLVKREALLKDLHATGILSFLNAKQKSVLQSLIHNLSVISPATWKRITDLWNPSVPGSIPGALALQAKNLLISTWPLTWRHVVYDENRASVSPCSS